jgi:aldehyde dehydrogenase (NAD+)
MLAQQTSLNILNAPLAQMRNWFNTGTTKKYVYRRQQLHLLKAALLKYENDLYEALRVDLKKNKEEIWVTEIGFVVSEISNALKHLEGWMKPEKKSTNLLNIPSSSFIMPEPLGVVLIIAPWNYPVMLLLAPLVGAIAAGNCVVLKPSEFAPATASVMKKIIEETFDEKYILYVEGDGAEVIPDMMNSFVFDHVFYTGSTQVGKIIYQLAAKNLMPVTLELGGKSPCIVEADANLKVAAKRITVTKFSNAGQTCVAPDYLLVHASVKEALVNELKACITEFYTDRPEHFDGYGKIINQKQFKRISQYLTQGTILHGGNYDESSLFIQPTLLDNISLDDTVMQDEIFGPVLPVISYQTKKEALDIIAVHKNPLAFYLFTSNKKNEMQWLNDVAFGGGCINNASLHVTNHHLPFGGRGFSGMGGYHGKFSFDVFSHKKAIMRTPTWFDPAMKYPPYEGKLKWFKKILK